MRFLVVDDSRAVLAIIRRTLLKAFPGVELQMAADGQQALDLIEHWAPDLIISDWHMPMLDGMDLLKAVRKYYPAIKFGFATTEFLPERIALAMSTGALFVVQKPFSDEILVAEVTKALSSASISPDSTLEVQPDKLLVVAMSGDGVASIMGGVFGLNTFKIDPLPEVATDVIDLPSAVGIYMHESSKVIHGLALIDHAGMLLLGGSMAKKTFPALEALMMSNKVPDDIWTSVQSFMTRDISRMFISSDKCALKLMKCQMINHRPEQLISVMTRSTSRNDFSITRSSLLPGRLTLISK